MVFENVEYPQIYIYGKDIPMDDPPWMMLIINTLIAFSFLFTKMLQHFLNLHIPRKLLIVLFTLIFVGVQKKYEYFQRIIRQSTFDSPIDLFALYLPTFLLRSVYNTDRKRFFRLLPVSFILSFVPLVGGFIQAAVLKPMLGSWSYLDCVTFAVMFMTVQPFFLVNLLKTTDKYKNSLPLFRTYTILSAIWCGVTVEYAVSIHLKEFLAWSDLLLTLIRHTLISLIVGFFLAKFATLTLIIFVWDTTASICILLSCLIVGFYISNMLALSEYLTILVIAYVVLYDKDRFSSDTEKYITAFFEYLGTLVDMAVFSYCCFMITALAEPFDFKHLSMLGFNYVFVIMVRCALLILLHPLVNKLRNYLTFGNVIVLAWGSTVGNVALIVCLHLHSVEETKRIALAAIPYLLFSCVAGSIINNTGISIILRTLNSNMVTQTMIQSIVSKLNFLLDERNRFIEVVKMNRRLADVNWVFVKQLTTVKMPPPFPKHLEITGTKQEEVKICCTVCPYDVTLSMSPKKIIQFKKELNKNLVNEMKAILVRQHESGLISLGVSSTLIRGWQIYLNLEVEPAQKLAYIDKFFKKSAILELARKCDSLGFTAFKHVSVNPRKRINKFCHQICKHKAFRTLTYVIICWCAAEPIISVSSFYAISQLAHAALVVFQLTIAYFFVEFVVAVMSYVWFRFVRGGFVIYFSSAWNCVQFVALLLMFVELYIAYAYHKHYMGEIMDGSYYDYFYYARFLRFLRFFQVLVGIIPRIAAMLNTQADLSVAFGYELAKVFEGILQPNQFPEALKECHDELLIIIDRVVESSEMREHFVVKISAERMILFTYLLKLQMDTPWLAPTVKTRQMVNSTRCALINALQKMKYSGSVEGLEYNQILSVIVGKNRGMKILSKIQPVSGLVLFESVSWIDQRTLEFLYSHIQVELFHKGSQICTEGTFTKGVYLVLSGLLKLRYTPSEHVVEDWIQNGQLPIIDYLNTTNIEKKIEEYIMQGNTIGELSVLTGMPYNCTITAETEVKLYVMKRKYLRQAFSWQPDPIKGVESRMWKYSTINLATSILMSTTAYQFYTLREIQNKLQRSFVPNLQRYKIFVVTNLMEDIILLEGVVVDFFTRDVYTAPCYLPRSVIKLCLAKCSFFDKDNPINTKLMIIPVPGINVDDIMSKEELLAEFLPEVAIKRLSIAQDRRSSIKATTKRGDGMRKAVYDMEKALKNAENFAKRDSEPEKSVGNLRE